MAFVFDKAIVNKVAKDMRLDKDVQDIIDLYKGSKEKWQSSVDDSELCYEFVLNKQWTDDEIAEFERTGRAPMVYNMILPRLNNLMGTQQTNRVSTKIRPSNRSQTQIADLLNGMWRAIWETKGGETELEKAFSDGLITKICGGFKVIVEPNEMGYLEYNFMCLNPISLTFDPNFRRGDLKDCQWIIEESWLSLDAIINAYGSFKEIGQHDKGLREVVKDLMSRLSGLFGGGDGDSEWYDKDGDLYKVLELQMREVVRRDLIVNVQTGEYISVEPKDTEALVKDGSHIFVSEQKLNRIRVKTLIPYFNKIVVNEIDKMDCDMFNIIPYFSFDFNNLKANNSSLVWTLLDPQRNLNKRTIQISNFIDHAINSPTLFGYEDKEAKEQMDEEGNRPGISLLIRSMKFPPRRLQPASIGMDVWQEKADSVAMMNDISGINETARGMSEHANESGRLFAMKAERTGATINTYLNNLSKSRKMIAEYFLKTVAKVYGDDNREVDTMDRKKELSQEIINMTGTDGQIFNDIRSFKGRVILDEAEYSITKMQENMQTKLAMSSIMPPEFVYWEYILTDSELPDIDNWIQYIQQQRGIMAEQSAMQQAQQEEQVALEQLALEKQLQEVPKTVEDNKK